tara:strand:- start:29 stop:856 length:828 start_codon:yes stop_codon:yes gene_type:complete
MPYLGPAPSGTFGTSAKDRFSGDGSTVAFTMTRSPGSVNKIDVFVDNVRQEPTIAYTVGGTTLTFTAAPDSGTNNIYVVHRTETQSVVPPNDINLAPSSVDATGDITGATLNADGDTSAGDNAAIGFTAAEGLILTGQGSTSDVTIKNDADATVASIATGTTILTISDDVNVVGRSSGTVTTDNDGVFDISVSNNFICTPSGDFTLTFSNPAAGQSGNVSLINSGGHTVSAHASVAINADILTALATAGTYHLAYYCSAASGNNTILVSASSVLT